MDRNARKNRARKKEKSTKQWTKEFDDIKRMYEFNGERHTD
jgi:hypothetical protein